MGDDMFLHPASIQAQHKNSEKRNTFSGTSEIFPLNFRLIYANDIPKNREESEIYEIMDVATEY